MPRVLRGHHIDVAIPPDPKSLMADLEKIGFAANAFLEEVSTVALSFVREEEERIAKSLITKDQPTEHVVCRFYMDVHRRTTYLMLRRHMAAWNLSAILFE